MNFAVDDDGGSETAAADAAHGLDREKPVGSRGVHADAELTLEFLDDVVAAAQIARGTETNLNVVLAGLLETEEIVERDNAVDLGERNAENLTRFDGDLAGNIPVGLLYTMQNHDKITRLCLPFFDERPELRRHRFEVVAH